jgi:hypothetical protein
MTSLHVTRSKDSSANGRNSPFPVAATTRVIPSRLMRSAMYETWWAEMSIPTTVGS